MNNFKLAPSILAADFARLGEEVAVVENAGAKYLHLDVMDGRFVPNISFGMPVITSLRKHSKLIFDVHLMIEQPENYVEQVAKAGADIITFHVEAMKDAQACRSLISKIHSVGCLAGLAINPKTPLSSLQEHIGEIDLALIMSVEPGFGGQDILQHTLEKASELSAHLAQNGLKLDIEMDGGIGYNNLGSVLSSGVNVVVAGSSIFGRPNPEAAVKQFIQYFEDYS